MHSAAWQKTFQQSLHTLFEDIKAFVLPLEEFGLLEDDIFYELFSILRRLHKTCNESVLKQLHKKEPLESEYFRWDLKECSEARRTRGSLCTS